MDLPVWARFVSARAAANEKPGAIDEPVTVGGTASIVLSHDERVPRRPLGGRCDYDLEIEYPRALSLTAIEANGPVLVRSARASVTVHAANGAVRVG